MIRPKIIRPKVIKPTKLKKITRPSLQKSYKTEYFAQKITRPNQEDYKTEFDKTCLKQQK